MKNKKAFLFDKSNYKYVIIGILFILVGFILMYGGGSDDPNVFSEKIYSLRRIRVAPAMILIGFGIQVYAILKSPKKTTLNPRKKSKLKAPKK